ncbi:hypothetical protein HD554DRAFT_1676311 [Boletus coccyginus]|nr:hypothetical protein HD554DRAFT_1676311 [Boletus coccyginus]
MTFLPHHTVVADSFGDRPPTNVGEPTSDEEIGHVLADDYPSTAAPCNRIDHPIHSACVTTLEDIQAQSFSSQDIWNDPAFSFPHYTHRGPLVESSADRTESVTSLADECHSSQATATSQAPLPSPFESSYYSHPFGRSQIVQDPMHIDAVQPTTTSLYSTSSVVQHPVFHPGHQASSQFRCFSGDVTVAPSPLPSPAASPVNEISVSPLSNTTHICRYSSTCNAVLDGTIHAVRTHLKQEHQFHGAAKQSIRCLWEGCGRILQRENIPRHIFTCHLRVKVSCRACGMILSRRDVQYSHARVCRATGQPSSQPRTDGSSANACSSFPSGSNPF